MKPLKFLPQSLVTMTFGLAIGFAPLQLAAAELQTLTWSGTTTEFLEPGTSYPIAAVSSSGLPVALKVEAGPATLINGALTITGSGTILVSAEQAGDATYSSARITRRFNMLSASFSESDATVPLHSASPIRVVGKYAFLTIPGPWVPGAPDVCELKVMDITDLANPLLVTTMNFDGFAGSIEIEGTLACVSVRSRNPLGIPLPGLVHILDISRPEQPVEVGTFEPAGSINTFQLLNQRLYIAGSQMSTPNGDFGGGLEIVDITHPTNPVKLGDFGAGRNYADVEIVGETAYAADPQAGLTLLDIHDPSKPTEKGPGLSMHYTAGVTVVGSIAYVSGSVSEVPGLRFGVNVVDVSDPFHPRLLRSVEMTTGPGEVRIFGDRAYVLETRAPNKAIGSLTRVHAWDIADPSDPIDDGYYENYGSFIGFNILGGSLYLGLNVPFMAPPYAGNSTTISIRFGRPQHLKLSLPQVTPFVTTPISNFVSSSTGLPIKLSVPYGPARIENNQVLLNNLGWVTILAEQQGDAVYVPETVQWTIKVTPPALGQRRSEGALELFWPDGLIGLSLLARQAMSDGDAWHEVDAPRIHGGGEERVRVTTESGNQFFRLQSH